MKLQLITIAALTVGLVAAPVAAHAVDIPDTGGGIDCATEQMYVYNLPTEGVTTYYAALPYEVESYCGHPATVTWSDEQQASPVEVVAEPIVVKPAEPAPLLAAPVVAPLVHVKLLGKH